MFAWLSTSGEAYRKQAAVIHVLITNVSSIAALALSGL